jgi:Ca2+-binding EF-hand superfamily protein
MRQLLPALLVLTLAGCGAPGAPIAALRAGAAPQAQAKAAIVAAFRATARRAIARMDRDGDGRLARTEVDEHLSGAFDQIDANADGWLTLTEMTAHAATPEMVAYIQAELLAHFQEADRNQDARLDVAEFDWVRENQIFYSSKLKAADFPAADRNRDGKLTASEFENQAALTSL